MRRLLKSVLERLGGFQISLNREMEYFVALAMACATASLVAVAVLMKK